MALKQILSLSSLGALIGTSFSSPLVPEVRQYISTGSSITGLQTLTTCSTLAVGPSNSACLFLVTLTEPGGSLVTLFATSSVTGLQSLTLSDSTLTVEPTAVASSGSPSLTPSGSTSLIPSGSASFIVETLTQPGGSFITLTLPASTSIIGLETLTISSSTLTVEPSAVSSGSISLTATGSSSPTLIELSSLIPSGSASLPPSGPASLIIETFSQSGGSFITLTIPATASIGGLDPLTISNSPFTVESIPPTLSISVASSIVETLTEPNGPVLTLTAPASSSVSSNGLEALTISSSTSTVKPIASVSSVSVSSFIVSTLTQPDGPIITLPVPASASTTGIETLITSGSTLNVESIPTTSSVSSLAFGLFSNLATFTEPDSSSIFLTLPLGSILTGLQTITTNGQTFTVPFLPPTTTSAATVTSTMTTSPTGLSIQPYTEAPVTGNMWLTTTGSDHSTTIVPVILPCVKCVPQIIWGLPEIPNVEFHLPGFPQLPSFHLPCIKFFGVRLAGSCSDPPQNDTPPESPEPTTSPTESASSDSTTSTSSTSSTSTSTSTSSSSASSSSSSSESFCSALPIELALPPQLVAATVTLTSYSVSGSSGTASQTAFSTSLSSSSLSYSSSLSLTTLLSSTSTMLPSSTTSSSSTTLSPSIVLMIPTGLLPLTTSSESLPSLPPLPPLTPLSITTVEPISPISGSSCVATTTTTICEVPRNPCITSDVCISYIATATPPPPPISSTTALPPPPPPSSATSPSDPVPTGQVYIDIFSDTGCYDQIGVIELTATGQCYKPVQASGKPVTFRCFLFTYISPTAMNLGPLSVFDNDNCYRTHSREKDYPSLTEIQHKLNSPFAMKSLRFGAIGG